MGVCDCGGVGVCDCGCGGVVLAVSGQAVEGRNISDHCALN